MGDDLNPELLKFHMWVTAMDDTIGEFLSTLPEEVRAKLDYSPESLDIVSEQLLKMFPNRNSLLAKNQRKIADGAACYIGKTFRKTLGGHWGNRYDTQGRPEPTIEGFNESGSAVAPHALVASLVNKKRDVKYLRVVLTFYQQGKP
jgi:hypothetical protein